MMNKQNLLEFSFNELKDFCLSLSLPNYKSKQIWNWIYCFGHSSFENMTNLGKSTRVLLQEKSYIYRPFIENMQQSVDGTIKWLIKLEDNSLIETVFIPQGKRGTVCLSSQVGCTLNCSFCYTGTQKLVRDLKSYEILSQLLIVMDHLNDWPSGKKNRNVTNIVMMGMGEPLLNYDNVKKALLTIMACDGIAISKRRITVSTSGIVPEIERCGNDLGVNLAISLHAVNDMLRNELVPINRKYNLNTLINACKNYPPLSNSRRITWEYVMIKDINDGEKDAFNLVRLLKDIPSKINLIPFNPWPGTNYKTSSKTKINAFAKVLMNSGFPSPIRSTRGNDILAACGQLKSKTEKKRKSLRKNILPMYEVL